MDHNFKQLSLTFAAIQSLQDLLQEFEEMNQNNRIYDSNLSLTKERLDKIQYHFLRGE